MVDMQPAPGLAYDDNVNLDAQRAEHGSTVRSVTVGGKRFELPPQLTVKTIRLFSKIASGGPTAAAASLDVLLEALFGEQADEAAGLITVDELGVIMARYGMTPGESSASPGS